MSSPHSVHFINPMTNSTGGSEWRTLHLYRELKRRCDVALWSPYAPDPLLAADYPVKFLVPGQAFPADGVLVFVGVFFNFHTDWLRLARPRRVIVIYNTNSPARLMYILNVLAQYGLHNIEIVFASEMLKRSVGLPGIVEPSLIDLDVFAPAGGMRAAGQRFCVGRLSRDARDKHHTRDPRFYRCLMQAGCSVRIMGGTCLSERLRGAPSAQLFPAGAQPAQTFLREIDCFFYRTSVHWLEAWGRVVTEAMACGLPVVCHASGGYREYIEHGRNGFLFRSDEEALEIIMQLKQDAVLREAIGKAARLSMEKIYSPAARQAVVDYYLR